MKTYTARFHLRKEKQKLTAESRELTQVTNNLKKLREMTAPKIKKITEANVKSISIEIERQKWKYPKINYQLKEITRPLQ